MDTTQKFSGKAEGYAKYRPKYSGEFIDYLATAAPLAPGSVVADIGSGTGILSRQLLDRGYAVLAVEPNRDMRKTAEKLLSSCTGFRSVNGVAEATTLDAASVDLVTVAQAFHWFDRGQFKTECRRILKEGAKAALVWNSRVQRSALVQESEKICKRLCPNFIAFSGGSESDPDVFRQLFRNGSYEYRSFQNDEVFHSLESFIGRSLSASYSPREGDGNYNEFIRELTRLFEKHSVAGVLTLPSETHSYLGQV